MKCNNSVFETTCTRVSKVKASWSSDLDVAVYKLAWVETVDGGHQADGYRVDGLDVDTDGQRDEIFEVQDQPRLGQNLEDK